MDETANESSESSEARAAVLVTQIDRAFPWTILGSNVTFGSALGVWLLDLLSRQGFQEVRH